MASPATGIPGAAVAVAAKSPPAASGLRIDDATWPVVPKLAEPPAHAHDDDVADVEGLLKVISRTSRVAGSTLLLRPGTYRLTAPLAITKEIEIYGRGVVLEAHGTAVTSSAPKALLVGLALVGVPPADKPLVAVTAGALRLVGCTLTSPSTCLDASGSAAPVLEACTITGSCIFRDRATGRLECCDLKASGTDGAGVTVRDAAAPLLRLCKISGARAAGVVLSGSGAPRLEGNRIKDNGVGVTLSTAGEAALGAIRAANDVRGNAAGDAGVSATATSAPLTSSHQPETGVAKPVAVVTPKLDEAHKQAEGHKTLAKDGTPPPPVVAPPAVAKPAVVEPPPKPVEVAKPAMVAPVVTAAPSPGHAAGVKPPGDMAAAPKPSDGAPTTAVAPPVSSRHDGGGPTPAVADRPVTPAPAPTPAAPTVAHLPTPALAAVSTAPPPASVVANSHPAAVAPVAVVPAPVVSTAPTVIPVPTVAPAMAHAPISVHAPTPAVVPVAASAPVVATPPVVVAPAPAPTPAPASTRAPASHVPAAPAAPAVSVNSATFDFYTALDGYLKGGRLRLYEAFDKFDADGNGKLDTREVGAVLATLLPTAPPASLAAVAAMLDAEADADRDGVITFDELVTFLKRARDKMRRGAAPSRPGAGAAAAPFDFFVVLDGHLAGTRTRLKQVFTEMDADHSGTLDKKEMGRFLRRLIPTATDGQATYFQVLLDADGDGAVSFDELVAFLRIARAAGRSAPAWEALDMRHVLRAVRTEMALEGVGVDALFVSPTGSRLPVLEYPLLDAALTKALPGLGLADRRFFVHHLRVGGGGTRGGAKGGATPAQVKAALLSDPEAATGAPASKAAAAPPRPRRRLDVEERQELRSRRAIHGSRALAGLSASFGPYGAYGDRATRAQREMDAASGAAAHIGRLAALRSAASSARPVSLSSGRRVYVTVRADTIPSPRRHHHHKDDHRDRHKATGEHALPPPEWSHGGAALHRPRSSQAGYPLWAEERGLLHLRGSQTTAAAHGRDRPARTSAFLPPVSGAVPTRMQGGKGGDPTAAVESILAGFRPVSPARWEPERPWASPGRGGIDFGRSLYTPAELGHERHAAAVFVPRTRDEIEAEEERRLGASAGGVYGSDGRSVVEGPPAARGGGYGASVGPRPAFGAGFRADHAPMPSPARGSVHIHGDGGRPTSGGKGKAPPGDDRTMTRRGFYDSAGSAAGGAVPSGRRAAREAIEYEAELAASVRATAAHRVATAAADSLPAAIRAASRGAPGSSSIPGLTLVGVGASPGMVGHRDWEADIAAALGMVDAARAAKGVGGGATTVGPTAAATPATVTTVTPAAVATAVATAVVAQAVTTGPPLAATAMPPTAPPPALPQVTVTAPTMAPPVTAAVAPVAPPPLVSTTPAVIVHKPVDPTIPGAAIAVGGGAPPSLPLATAAAAVTHTGAADVTAPAGVPAPAPAMVAPPGVTSPPPSVIYLLHPGSSLTIHPGGGTISAQLQPASSQGHPVVTPSLTPTLRPPPVYVGDRVVLDIPVPIAPPGATAHALDGALVDAAVYDESSSEVLSLIEHVLGEPGRFDRLRRKARVRYLSSADAYYRSASYLSVPAG